MPRAAALLIVFLLAACGNPRDVESSAAVDSSQTVETAVANGCPSADKDWHARDYAAFDEYLGRIPATDYPRHDSARSGGIFRKVVESIPQKTFRDADLALVARIDLVNRMSQALGLTLEKYVNAHAAGTDYSTEMAHLSGVVLDMCAAMVVLVDELLPTIDRDDPKYEQTAQGLEMARNVLAVVFGGALQSIGDTATFSHAERRILCESLLRNGAPIANFLKPTVKQEMQVKVARLIELEKDPELKALLEQAAFGLNLRGSSKRDRGR